MNARVRGCATVTSEPTVLAVRETKGWVGIQPQSERAAFPRCTV